MNEREEVVALGDDETVEMPAYGYTIRFYLKSGQTLETRAQGKFSRTLRGGKIVGFGFSYDDEKAPRFAYVDADDISAIVLG